MATDASEAAPNVASSTNAASKLKELVTVAAAKEAAKDYTAAADLYSQATELQAEINGEMAVANADLLYSYGKCLYRVAVSKSDVLGANIPAGVSGEPKSAVSAKGPPDSSKRAPESEKQKTRKQSDQPAASADPAQSSSYFQFIGDDNFDNSEEEDFSDAEGGDADADDDDDFATAFETLDLARILFLRRLEEISAADSTSGSGEDGSAAIRRVKERLSDIYDLQAEISLEGERFSDAVADLQAALELNEELFPVEDPVVAECHYKLSLALEFASIIKREDGESESNAPTKFDMTKRKEAEKHMERAIESCRRRVSKEEQRLNTGAIDDAEKAAVLRRKVAEVKEIVADMEQRLLDLQRDPQPSLLDSGEADTDARLKNIVGSALEDLTKNANDLSSFVRKKKQPAETTTTPGSPGPSGGNKKRDFEQASLSDDESVGSKREKR